jgi:hypothetical protein
MDLRDIEWDSMNLFFWGGRVQDWDKWRALVNTVMNTGVP